jgi:hypothetical protein
MTEADLDEFDQSRTTRALVKPSEPAALEKLLADLASKRNR